MRRRPKRQPNQPNQHRPRHGQEDNTHFHHLLELFHFSGLVVVFLEVGGSGSCEDDAGDDEHVEEDGEDGGEFFGVAVIAGAVDCSFIHYMLVMYIH